MTGSSPCAACTRRCCSQYTVSVTGYDAWLISVGLRMPCELFLVYYPVAEDNQRGFRLEKGGERYDIALDKAGQFQKGNPCVFWVDLANERGRCGIYALRPLVCQTYPAYIQDDVVMLRDDVLCPQGSWQLAGMGLTEFRDRLLRFRMELDIYAYVVDRWNEQVERIARGHSVDEYYAYLMNVYGALEALRAELETAQWMEIVQAWNRQDPSWPNPLAADLRANAGDAWAEVLTEIRTRVDRFVAPSQGTTERAAVAAV